MTLWQFSGLLDVIRAILMQYSNCDIVRVIYGTKKSIYICFNLYDKTFSTPQNSNTAKVATKWTVSNFSDKNAIVFESRCVNVEPWEATLSAPRTSHLDVTWCAIVHPSGLLGSPSVYLWKRSSRQLLIQAATIWVDERFENELKKSISERNDYLSE